MQEGKNTFIKTFSERPECKLAVFACVKGTEKHSIVSLCRRLKLKNSNCQYLHTMEGGMIHRIVQNLRQVDSTLSTSKYLNMRQEQRLDGTVHHLQEIDSFNSKPQVLAHAKNKENWSPHWSLLTLYGEQHIREENTRVTLVHLLCRRL